MPAATTTRTTSTDLALALRTTYTTPLLTNIATGNDITAADINMLAAFTNVILGHTHKLTEYTSISEYGNTGTTVSVNRTTSIPTENALAWTNVVAGADISAANYSALRTSANDLISHSHTFTDSY